MTWTSDLLNPLYYGSVSKIALPLTLVIIALISIIYFYIQVRKRQLEIVSVVRWVALMIVYIGVVLYILIVSIMQAFNYPVINFMDYIMRYWFNIRFTHGQEYIFFIIMMFLFYGLYRNIRNSVNTEKLEKQLDSVAREIALLKGVINKTAPFESKAFEINEKSSNQIKREYKDKIKSVKTIARESKRLDYLKMKNNISDTDILNLKYNNKVNSTDRWINKPELLETDNSKKDLNVDKNIQIDKGENTNEKI